MSPLRYGKSEFIIRINDGMRIDQDLPYSYADFPRDKTEIKILQNVSDSFKLKGS